MRRLTRWALWVLVFCLPWEEAFPLPGVGTLSRAAGYAALGFAVFAVLTTKGLRRPGPVLGFMAAFLVWCIASGFWAMDEQASWSRILTLIRVVGLAWLVWEFAREEWEQLRLIQAYVLGCCVVVVGLLQAAVQGRSIEVAGEIRYRTAGVNEDDLALLLALSIPMAIYLATREGGRRKQLAWFYRAYAVLAGVCVLLTGSRGGFLAMSVGVAFFAWTYSRRSPRRRLGLVTLVVVTAAAAQYLVPSSTIGRLGGTAAEIKYGDWSERKTILEVGMEVLSEHPVAGVGYGSFDYAIGLKYRPRAPHNTFLSILVGTGTVGICLFSLVLLRLGANALRLSPRERFFWLSVLLIWALGGLSVGWDYAKATWLILGLAASQASTLLEVGRGVAAVRGPARGHSPVVRTRRVGLPRGRLRAGSVPQVRKAAVEAPAREPLEGARQGSLPRSTTEPGPWVVPSR